MIVRKFKENIVKTAVFFLIASALSCSGGTSASGTIDPGKVVAVVGGVKITQAELDRNSKRAIASLEEEIITKKTMVLNSLIAGKVIEVEAGRRGVSKDKLLEQEVDANVTPPADEELKKVLDDPRNKNAMETEMKSLASEEEKNKKLESIKETIRKNMMQQKRKQLYDDFIKRLNESVKVEMFWPPRVEIALGNEPVKGKSSAPVTIVEYSDFQCPFCSRAADSLHKVAEEYPDTIRIAFRHFPLTNIHPFALKAAEASECANEQGKFWEYHDILFQNQKELGIEKLKEYSGRIGLDTAKFAECLDSGKTSGVIEKSMDEADERGIHSTPSIYVNGLRVGGRDLVGELKRIIDTELNRIGYPAKKG